MIILKLGLVLGTFVLVGVVVQIMLGFQIAGAGAKNLITPHITIGILGLALVMVLSIVSFRTKTANLYSKIIMTILTIIILLQVVLGFQLLNRPTSMIISHEANGFLILILTLVNGAVTMRSHKKQN